AAGDAGVARGDGGFAAGGGDLGLVDDAPAAGAQILDHAFPEEEQEVAGGGENGEAGGGAAGEKGDRVEQPGEGGEPANLHREDEEEHHDEARVEVREGQEDGAVDEDVGGDDVGHDEAGDDGEGVADEEEEVVADEAPVMLEGGAEEVE